MLKTPPLQTATATIDTLAGRLHSATLLEDRRAAILGLRSFAKQYPASVASGSLRELITTLRRDGLGQKAGSSDAGRRSEEGTGDVDTIRLVLETLLMLFNPDSGSPEAGDEIAFFMADEFSMRQDNVALLLSLLDPASPYADYYARLYSVQLLSAICAARPERLQECILSAPLGISRLVSMLDDSRDAVRNAGLLLLVDLTSGANEDLRKIVAFEEVFSKVFTLIQTEGGLAEAGITTQDCLTLLANLVGKSSSNQKMFRESGCVTQLSRLLQQVFPPSGLEAAFIVQNREKSAFGLLQLLRFFFVPGETGTPQNQLAFFRAGTAQTLIDIGFSGQLPIPIRTASLKCVAELIANNAQLQEQFAALTVVTPADAEKASTPALPPQTNGTRSTGPSNKGSARQSVEKPRTYIIEALLDLTLDQPQDDPILRSATCGLVQAYLIKHDRIKAHFLQRAIYGHSQQEDAANVLTTLSHSTEKDPLALLFASWIVQDLIADNLDAKTALASVTEGDENAGEDVLSFTQILASQLEGALIKSDEDETVVAAYASLLVVLLWDFAPGVDDLLTESSSLMQELSNAQRAPASDPIAAGLSATLLGTIYEFSTKDSPMPRRTLTPLLTQRLGRSKYLEALVEFRRHSSIRDFELSETEDALFNLAFVELFMLEFSRLRRAIDKDPGIEVLPPSAAEAGVDRDVLDDLRQQLQTSKDALAQEQETASASSQKYDQERLTTSKELQTATAEVQRLQRINQAMQQGHESEIEKLEAQHEKQKQDTHATHQRTLGIAQQETQQQIQNAVRERDASFAQKMQDYERRIAELGNAHRAEQGGHSNTRQQLEALQTIHTDLTTREKSLNDQLADITQRHTRLERDHSQLQTTSTQSTSQLSQAQAESSRLQTSLESLTAQLKELQDELKGKEEELATERAGFADLEKELEATKSRTDSTEPASEDSEKLKTQLEEAKQSEQSAKEELESMLLVMGDIEAKRDKYREKVKAMGGEVSEDEESEDDEEEGEGEEGEDNDDEDEVD